MSIASDPTFALYVFSASLLVLLILALAFATGTVRGFIERTYPNPEDAVVNKKNVLAADGELTARFKRAHQNALENILPFLAVGLLWVATAPSYTTTLWLFAIFTGARIVHSLAYVFRLQPFRTLSFFVGWGTLVAMTALLLVRALPYVS